MMTMLLVLRPSRFLNDKSSFSAELAASLIDIISMLSAPS